MKRNIIRKSLEIIARPLSTFLHKAGIIKPVFILRMDGGISSQIYFYMIGKYLSEKSGYPLYFDLIWFDKVGKDMDGKQVRNFDLLKFAPDLDFKIAQNNWKTHLYRLLYTHEQNWDDHYRKWEALKPPLYLTGYYGPYNELYEDIAKVFMAQPEGLSIQDQKMASDIISRPNTVGVHIRRGDLQNYLPAYGEPAPEAYFKKAIIELKNKYGRDLYFYFFSDDHDWVRSFVEERLPPGNYVIADCNKSDKGYVDLWLLSKCKHFISSAGSFGKFGSALNPSHGDVYVYSTPQSQVWQQRLKSVHLIR